MPYKYNHFPHGSVDLSRCFFFKIEFVVELDLSNLKYEEYPMDETLRNMITVTSSSMQETTSVRNLLYHFLNIPLSLPLSLLRKKICFWLVNSNEFFL